MKTAHLSLLLAASLLVASSCDEDDDTRLSTDAATDSADASVRADTAADLSTHDGLAHQRLDVAPAPEPLRFARQWGTAGDDHALSVAVDSVGNVFVAGYEDGIARRSIEPMGKPRGFIDKWDRNGRSFRYERTSAGADVVDALALTANGVAFAGRHASPPGTARGAYDMVVGELDGSGRELMSWTGGTSRPEHPARMAVMGESFVVAGWTDLHIPTNYVEAWEDPLLLVWRPTQAVTWPANHTRGRDTVTALAIDEPRHGMYVGGWATLGARRSAFISKLDTNAREEWTHVVSGSPPDEVAALRVLNGGDLLIAGTTGRKMGARSYGGTDLFLMRFDPDFRLPIWTTQMGSTAAERTIDMAIDSSGVVHVLAEVADRAGGGGANVVVYSLASDGQVLRSVERDTPGDDRPSAIATGTRRELVVAGATAGRLGEGTTPQGGYDAFLITFPPL